MKNTAQDFTSIITRILPHLEEYIEESQNGDSPVLKQPIASELAEQLQLEKWIYEGGLDTNNVMTFLSPYLESSQHMHHPRYLGHQVASSHLASGVADFVHGVINNPMAIYEMGPGGAVIEQTMVNWMLQKVGWFNEQNITDFTQKTENGSGIMTHGGSMANLTALLAARAKVAPQAWENGNPDNLVVIAPDVSHYSIARAISIMGLGHSAIYKMPTDNHEMVNLQSLKNTYEAAKNDGKIVMAVVINGCATATGLYDPVEDIGDFCNQEGLWLHIDGAHGASALVSEHEKHLLAGVEKADSLIWDTHKMLRTTTLCAAVLFKDSQSMASTFQQKGSYLFHDKETPGFDLMNYTLECTKAPIATKLFWVLAAEGEQALSDYVSHQYAITRDFYHVIHDASDFECPYKPQSNILCFRYTGGPEGNDFQLSLRNELIKRGKFYITSTELNGIRHLRIVVLNEHTCLEHIQQLLQEIRSIANEQ